MTLEDYADWCLHAGIYIEKRSISERYQTHRQKLSFEGANSLIVQNFLEKNPNGIDLLSWQRHEVYPAYTGNAPLVQVKLTSEALHEVGAERVAKVIPTVDWRTQKAIDDAAKLETRDDIVALLGKYVALHQQAFADDVSRYGDVRSTPGFDPDKNLEKLADQRRRILGMEYQRDLLQRLAETVAMLKQVLETNAWKKKHLEQWKEIREVYQQYTKSKAEDLTPEMTEWLKEIKTLQVQYNAVLNPPPFKDKELLQQLAQLGQYKSDSDDGELTIEVVDVNGLECPWGRLSVEFVLPVKKPDTAFKILLKTLTAFVATWDKQINQIRREILDQFANYRGEMGRDELARYQDDSGRITDDKILSQVRGGCLNLSFEDWPHEKEPFAELFCGVEWDAEHGFHMQLERPETAD